MDILFRVRVERFQINSNMDRHEQSSAIVLVFS